MYIPSAHLHEGNGRQTLWMQPWLQGSRGASSQTAVCVGFLYAVTADLEYLSKDWRLEHCNSVSFCWGCGARQDDGPLNFRNAHPEAPWRRTMVSPEGCAFDNGHPVWDAAGLSRFSVVGDWAHSGQMGVLPIVVGGAFEELASGYEGNSAEQAAAVETMCSESIANSACRSLCAH